MYKIFSTFLPAAALLSTVLSCGGTDETAPATDSGPAVDSSTTSIDGAVNTDGGDGGGTPTDGGGTDSGSDAGPETCEAVTLPSVTFQNIAGSRRFDQPVYVTHAGNDDLYVAEMRGEIHIVRSGVVLSTPFLDIESSLVSERANYDERGLLGLAFHPDYTTNGRFFVAYSATSTTTDHMDVVAEYQRSASNPDVASSVEVRRLITINNRAFNHNGGMMAFGPDGQLYVGFGDEGGGCDQHGLPLGNAQNTNNIFGSIVRLDVDNGPSYAAADNPFTTVAGSDNRIWAYGLRNPWRFSFDRRTGDMYIGDAGQDAWEEINFQPASSTGGENYGWRRFEGNALSSDSGCTNLPGVVGDVKPIAVHAHASLPGTPTDSFFPGSFVAITGGYVYRGSAIPELQGVYLYTEWDVDSVPIVGLRYCDGARQSQAAVPGLNAAFVGSFGEGVDGELYIVQTSGVVSRIIPR